MFGFLKKGLIGLGLISSVQASYAEQSRDVCADQKKVEISLKRKYPNKQKNEKSDTIELGKRKICY